MADTLSCVRLVKFYAWEEAVTQAVSRLRAREGRLLFFSNLLNGFTESLQSCSNSVMMILLLGTYAALNRPVVLTAAHSFSALYMLFIIDMVFKNMPTVFRYGSMVSHGLKRMMKTLTAEEDVIGADVKENLEVRKGAVLLEKCTFCWSGLERGKRKSLGPDTPTLYDVSLDIAPGTLLGVVGLVGSGKSALLAAILGELRRLRGTARVGGDTLSGGQKQRVALARAVYSDSDVYLIDDTLSALDVHTAAKVFARVIGPEGLLRDKTRIMVCSQEAFVKHVDKLLLLSDNRVVPYGSLSELNADAVAPKTLLFGSRQKAPSTAKRRDSGCDALLTVESGVAAQLTSQEIRDTSLTAVELLRSFVTMSGACLPLAVLCILAHAVAVWLFLIGTKAWTDASTAVPFGDVSTTTWVTVLAALCLCDLLLCSLGGFLLALSFRRLSARVHASMLRRVLSCALSFFEATPRGRLLNRFSADLHQVDCQLCVTGKEVLQAVTVALANLAAAGSQAPAAAGLGVLALAAYLVVAVVTVRASSALRCLESAWLSRMLQHLTETRDSMSSVRCYGAAALVCGRFYRLVDGALRPFWALVACVRLTGLAGAAAGLCAVVGSLLAVSLADSGLSQSGLGLALSASMSISMSLAAVNASLFFCFLNAISFERALEFTRLPPEEDTGHKDDSHKPQKGKKVAADNSTDAQGAWPVEGEIVFDDFSTSYKPGVLPQVLINVSFVIKAREKASFWWVRYARIRAT
ncbi:ATP-binding cassette sub-family C member 3-like isoform X2 [Dermacentor andersoni]|uniref:ATP-binding cassette sub-family C member 3-like isoform X2 n=1 Tax=Dermacentor andersoni TaxID=34620 RepID=UPI0024167B8B|nr:multidrug resistance protein mrp-7-like isoform X2 [Dermacentor andersoni]